MRAFARINAISIDPSARLPDEDVLGIADKVAVSYPVGALADAAKFISGAAVGVLWTAVSPTFCFGAAAVMMAAGTFALLRAR